MPDKTPKEVATVLSQRAKSSRIALLTSPKKVPVNGNDPKDANDPKSDTFTIVESTAPSSTAESAITTSVLVHQNARSPARLPDIDTLPSKSNMDPVQEKFDEGNGPTPPKQRAVKGDVK